MTYFITSYCSLRILRRLLILPHFTPLNPVDSAISIIYHLISSILHHTNVLTTLKEQECNDSEQTYGHAGAWPSTRSGEKHSHTPHYTHQKLHSSHYLQPFPEHLPIMAPTYIALPSTSFLHACNSMHSCFPSSYLLTSSALSSLLPFLLSPSCPLVLTLLPLLSSLTYPLLPSPSSLWLPYSLPQVFGSHEDDLLMTEGSTGLREQITVGFLELADDLPQRLSVRTVLAGSSRLTLPRVLRHSHTSPIDHLSIYPFT